MLEKQREACPVGLRAQPDQMRRAVVKEWNGWSEGLMLAMPCTKGQAPLERVARPIEALP